MILTLYCVTIKRVLTLFGYFELEFILYVNVKIFYLFCGDMEIKMTSLCSPHSVECKKYTFYLKINKNKLGGMMFLILLNEYLLKYYHFNIIVLFGIFQILKKVSCHLSMRLHFPCFVCKIDFFVLFFFHVKVRQTGCAIPRSPLIGCQLSCGVLDVLG